MWSKSNPYITPEPVKAEQIGWGVPTIQRLWFGYVYCFLLQLRLMEDKKIHTEFSLAARA